MDPASVTVTLVPDRVNAAVSSSVVVAVTVWSASASKALSLEVSTTETVTAVVWFPSARSSFTPVTVTVWALFQSELVNVNWAGDTVASPVSADETPSTTSEDGWAPSTAVNVVVDPASEMVILVPERVKDAVSSSEVLTDTVESTTESYASSDDPSTTVTVTAVVWLPSIKLSSAPVTVTVCAVSQSLLEKVNCAGATVASPVSADETLSTTSEEGWASSTTVKVAVDPPSETVTLALERVTDGAVVDDTNWANAQSSSLLFFELPARSTLPLAARPMV